MKIAWFKTAISPEIGCLISGYGWDFYSVKRSDDIYMTGLCCDDGNNKVLVISFDLLALDESFIRRIREKSADILGIPESAILLTCTHNHSGPQTIKEAGHEHQLHTEYVSALEKQILSEVRKIKDAEFQEVDMYYYSCQSDENRNRRYVTADNCASFTPYRFEVSPIANGIADKELGIVIFQTPDHGDPVYVIGNYAAHPLAGHAPGLGGVRISADFPGAFRDYITEETGAEAMFISGALGDLVPREDELGADASRQMGIRLAKSCIRGMIDAPRNPARFLVKEPKVGSLIKSCSFRLRKKFRNNPETLMSDYLGKDDITMDIQCVSIGDICFVGMPGEVCNELGLEIKWHSPFRRTFIAFVATAYIDYVCPGNFLVSGGYEAMSHKFSARDSINFVKTAVDATYELRETVYPSEDENDPYPDNLNHQLVNIPPGR